ncbi:MAG: DNA primase [Candidatus Moranbacteria bacterium]|nr:DNA primase [Candidatus Moranbacteria bacterium]
MNEVEEIKSKLNIVELVSNYIRLNKAGANHKALCPFHNEKTPSFMVSEEKQIFHCFGCGKGGDIFTFVQEIEGLNFREALELLAQRAGVKLEKRSFKSKKDDDNSNRLREIMGLAVREYMRNLRLESGLEVRNYLKKRGVDKNLAQKFWLGFSIDDWRFILNKFQEKGVSAFDLEKAGLAVSSKKKPGNYYDRFRNRLMFPIANSYGEPIGFSGRVLPWDKTEMGKYINSPQTVLYDKSKAIYGLHLAKQAIKQKDFCIILEGNLDVVMSHKAGVSNVVAACGTAVTTEQIKVIQRYSNNIAFAFDVDEAGIEASKKGIDVALAAGANVSAIDLASISKTGKDVADIVLEDKDKWFNVSSKYKSAMDYYFDLIIKRADFSDSASRKKAIDEFLDKVAILPDKIDQAYYLENLAEASKIKVDILYEALNDKTAQKRQRAYYDRINAQKIEPASQTDTKDRDKKRAGVNRLLKRLLMLMLFYSKDYDNEDRLKVYDLLGEFKDNQIAEVLKIIIESNQKFTDPDEYLNLIKDSELKTKTARLIMIGEELFEKIEKESRNGNFSPERDLAFCLKRIKEINKKAKLKELFEEIKEAEAQKDKKTQTKLMARYMEIKKE